MLISKFDLYKTEWLDLVFDDRNKSYGAYELRQHYPRTMVRAMVITFLTIGSAALIAGILVKPVMAAVQPLVHITPFKLVIPVKPAEITHPHVTHVQSRSSSSSAHPAIVIVQPSIPVVAPDVQAKPTAIIPASIDPGPVDLNGPTATGPGLIGPSTVPGPQSSGEVVSDFHSLERMPEPVGGASAWSKFLMKNIKYPDMASDQHASGAVWVSFIIEADGRLSNFKVLRGAGYGMDEEALRVLKMAPAWKPGIQNGQPVRVSYNIPIRFILGDDSN